MLRILAIGFYKLNQSEVERTKSVQRNSSQNELKKLEDEILPKFANKLSPIQITHIADANEHYYFEKKPDGNVIVMMTFGNALDSRTFTNLFINIKQFKDDDKKLEEMILNPINYTKDMSKATQTVTKIETEIAETKEILIETINKGLERGEMIERLVPETIKLKEDAIAFHKATKRCCR